MHVKNVLMGIMVLVCLGGSVLSAHEGEFDFLLGVNNGQLEMRTLQSGPVVLPVSQNAFFPGWMSIEPAFRSYDPGVDVGIDSTDFGQAGDGADIYLTLLSADVGLHFALLGGADFQENIPLLLDNGNSPFDQHVHLHIDNTILPNYDGTPLSATFRYSDGGSTGYAASESFTITFVPEPFSAGLLGLGSLVFLRHRRREWSKICV